MDTAGTQTSFYDAFISYGRVDSKDFAIRLSQRLIEQGLSVWLDQNDIPLAVDFQAQIDDGLEKAHNFLFIIAPHSVNSPYCAKEIDLALKRHKRVIPLMHVEQISRETWQRRNPNGTDAQWADYQARGLHSSFPNLHPMIGKINWVFFREGVDDFDKSFQDLLSIFQRHRDYVQQHTLLLTQALEWERQQQQTRYLLIGEERQQAEQWLQQRFREEQPPCEPTPLHCEFICESIKNANNLMTQVFLAHAEADGEITERIRGFLLRQGITVWISKLDIQTGETFEAAIDRGIEQTDTVVYLLSPAALQSAYCQRELDYAFNLHKRIIPLLIQPTELEQIPANLRSLQFINFTDNTTEADYQRDVDQLVRVLREDATYYEEHKILLTQALKWERQSCNPTILLRGYNLRRAEDWLKGSRLRSQHPPTALQETFINESLRQPPAASLDVFISYSRADSELARRLNEELQLRGRTTWFDQESIASGTDFQQEIYRGIESADNFLFVLSPRSVNSPYCTDEVEYAAKLNKRFITLLYRSVNTAELHPELAKVQWIDFTRSGGDFASNMNRLVRTLETDREHVHSHTKWSLRALAWQEHNRNEDLLLRGTERETATAWLQEGMTGNKQPAPTELQRVFITASNELHDRDQARQRRSILILRTVSIIASSLALLAGGLAVFAYGQQKRATEQEASAKTQRDEAQKQRDDAQKQRQVAEQERNNAQAALKEATTQKQIAQTQQKRADEQARNAETQKQKAQEQTTIAQTQQKRAEEQTIIAQTQQKRAEEQTTLAQTQKKLAEEQTAIAQAQKNDAEVNFQSIAAQNLLASNLNFEAILAGLKAGQKVKQNPSLDPGTRIRAIAALREVVYSGYEKNRLESHSSYVFSVSFSPDGKTIATASFDNTVKLWNLRGQELLTLKGHSGSVSSVSFSPDGKTIATASEDNTVKLWNLQGQELLTLGGHSGTVNSVSFSPDGKTIATASGDKTVKLWNLQGQELLTLKGHSSTVFSVSFSPDGKTLATASEDKTAKLWNLQGQQLQTFKGHSESVLSASFSPDGKTLATASVDKTAKLWNLQGQDLLTLKGHSNTVFSVSFSPDGKTLATASADNTVKLWNLQGQELLTLKGHSSTVFSVSFSPDGKTLTTASFDNTAKLWNLQGQELLTLKGHSGSVSSMSFSPDGKTIATASADNTVKLWNLQGEELQIFKGHSDFVSSVSFSPDGKTLATASGDGTVKLWNLQGQELLTLKGHSGPVYSVSFSPDGKTLATASYDNTVKLWNLQGQQLQSFKGHRDSVYSVSFSPDGKTLATRGDNTVKLWNLQGEELQIFKGHSSTVFSVSFSPDGKTLATASEDNTVKLWNLQGQELQSFKGYRDSVSSVSFSPDGKTLVTASGDGTVILWNLDLDDLLRRGCARLHDYLTYNPNGQKERQVCDGISQPAPGRSASTSFNWPQQWWASFVHWLPGQQG